MRIKTIITLALTFVIGISTYVPTFANNADREVKVMTYNMYIGTDFSGIFGARSGEELVAEVGEAFSDVQAGLVQERIDEIADQIASESPDLVGLQEVALWRSGAIFSPDPAETVEFDFLQMLLDSLAARGMHYAAISVQENLDAELPAASTTFAMDVRFTDRIAIIARTDLPVSELKLEGTAKSAFSVNLPVPLLNGFVIVTRGWTSADVKHRGKTYRFVNAHLESFNETVQNIQALELLQSPADTDLPVILLGDFNSDAAVGGSSYAALLGGGFSDAWSITQPSAPGFTWPLSDESPAVSKPPTQRLDLILGRGAITFSDADVIGEDIPADLTPSGLRPSDHAGVVATVVLQP